MSSPQSVHTTKDKSGNLVQAGSIVRVVSINDAVLEPLDKNERELVSSMLNESFAVYEIDQWGKAWVEKLWHESEVNSMSHSLALEPNEMELVTNV